MIYPEGFIRLKIRFRPKMAKRSGWMIYLVDDITGFYCTGDELLSFLFVFFLLFFLGMADYDVFARHPILGAWRDRVRQVVGPHYETAHRVVREFTAKYGGVPPLKG